jgi:hypothetical protein
MVTYENKEKADDISVEFIFFEIADTNTAIFVYHS